MKSVGIICEYNPFHNGHLYHLNKVKEMCPDYTVILVMSGHFLQRGEPAILNKWDRTKISLEYGVDLVIELPFLFSTRGADVFAYAAVEILNHLQVDKIIFGSELNNINFLKKIAGINYEDELFKEIIKSKLNEGNSYPAAFNKAINEITNESLETPNDILGVSYIKAINKINPKIEALTIQRTNDFHSEKIDNKIASATSIRKAIKEKKDIKDVVPPFTNELLNNNNIFLIEDYFHLLKYKIFVDSNYLNTFHSVDEGIENRILKYITKSSSIDELIKSVKTKRFTYNKIRRMFTHIMIGLTKEFVTKFPNVPYIRILGFNNNGQNYLNKIKKLVEIPIISNITKFSHPVLELEKRVTGVYASVLNETNKNNLIEQEYKNHPIKKD